MWRKKGRKFVKNDIASVLTSALKKINYHGKQRALCYGCDKHVTQTLLLGSST